MKVESVRLRDAVRVVGPGGGTRDYFAVPDVTLEFVTAPPALKISSAEPGAKPVYTPISNVLQWHEVAEGEAAETSSAPRRRG